MKTKILGGAIALTLSTMLTATPQAMAVSGDAGGIEQSIQPASEPLDEQTADEQSSEPTVPTLTFTSQNGRVELIVQGILWDGVQAIHINDQNITEIIENAIENGTVRITSTSTGFDMEFDDSTFLGNEGDLFTMILKTGTAVSVPVSVQTHHMVSPAAACAWLAFQAPTKTAPNKDCLYRSKECAVKGRFHTGIDYGHSSNESRNKAYAAADGKVVGVEPMHSRDHGMGNNVIIEHTLSNCKKVYSTYSHLHSIDKDVVRGKSIKRGDIVGVIGASGFGIIDWWTTSLKAKDNRHLHFEIKQKPVSGISYDDNKKSCAKDGHCWGYTPKDPDNYGYNNPSSF